MKERINKLIKKLNKNLFLFITLFFFVGTFELIFIEQMKRIGVHYLIAFSLSLIPLYLVFLIKWHIPEIKFPVQKEKFEPAFIKFSSLGIVFLFYALICVPIFFGGNRFEMSVDSFLYHNMITHSLTSVTSVFSLNTYASVYAISFQRGAEAIVALTQIAFLGRLTPLEAQSLVIGFLFCLSHLKMSKVVGALESMVLHILILSVPTVFLQSLTNYIDIFQIPILIIALSSLLLAKSKKEIFIALMWFGIFGAIKLPALMISIPLVVLISWYQHKKLNLLYLLFAGLIIGLISAPLLLINTFELGSPSAPYSFLFFGGWDIWSTNLLLNRPGVFEKTFFGIKLNNSIFLRFIYSHLRQFLIMNQTYDSRLGGGGMVNVFTLLSFLGILLAKFTKQIKLLIKKPRYKISVFNKIDVIIIIPTIFSFFVIPDTYWFRYMIIPFTLMIFYIMYYLSKIKYLPLKQGILIILAFIGLAGFFTLRNFLIPPSASNRQLDTFINFLHHDPDLEIQLEDFRSQTNDFKTVLFIVDTKNSSGSMVGNYVAALNPSATITYKDVQNIHDFNKEIAHYDAVIYSSTTFQLDDYLAKKAEFEQDGYGVIFLESVAHPDALVITEN
ncbi:hypothetical protein JW978_01225 [Candidatus Dojkabacteria bacterium]|nr:hypothetical protein [Candidatus Dojkabacteria bacterium]